MISISSNLPIVNEAKPLSHKCIPAIVNTITNIFPSDTLRVSVSVVASVPDPCPCPVGTSVIWKVFLLRFLSYNTSAQLFMSLSFLASPLPREDFASNFFVLLPVLLEGLSSVSYFSHCNNVNVTITKSKLNKDDDGFLNRQKSLCVSTIAL